MHSRIYRTRRVSLILQRHATTSSRYRRCAVKVYEQGQSSDADGNCRREQSVTVPKERQLAASGAAEIGVDVAVSVVLRSWRADDADVAHMATNMKWAESDFPRAMNFWAIPSHRAKSASVRGSDVLDSADQNPSDIRLDYWGVIIAGPRRLRMPLDGDTTDVNPIAARVDPTEIQKQEKIRQRSLLRDLIGSRRSSPATFGQENRERMTMQHQSSWSLRQKHISSPSRRTWRSKIFVPG